MVQRIIMYLLAQNGKAIKKVIKTNREYNGMIEVTSGLYSRRLLITAGYDMLNDGDAITVKNNKSKNIFMIR